MKAKQILFRADASVDIGTGHLSRCRTLAHAFRDAGWQTAFACRRIPGNWIAALREAGLIVFDLGERPVDSQAPESDAEAVMTAMEANLFKPTWIVVDHYSLDARWERRFRPGVHVLAIDDLADRAHDCDILLDQNPTAEGAARYATLVSPGCRVLTGLEYALLRDEFRDGVSHANIRAGELKRILVFYGGSDSTGETLKAIDAIVASQLKVEVDVVVGTSNTKRTAIETRCQKNGWGFHAPAARMADLMAKADVSLGAGGTTSWERCAMGLPSIVTVVADNQVGSAAALEKSGVALLAGNSPDATPEKISSLLRELAADPNRLRTMSQKSFRLVPSPGEGASKVLRAMEDRSADVQA